MEGVLAGLAFATAVNDAMEVWGKIERSFARVSQNRRGAQRLVREIGNDLNILKDIYEDHHETLDKSAKTETAIRTLIENMEQVLGKCSQLLPPVSEKRFEKYTLKYYAWKNGSKIEEELLDLKCHVSDCRQRFNTLAIARVEIQAIEHQQVTVSGNWIIRNMLSDLTVSANRLHAFDPHQSCISSSIIVDIPDEYLKLILSAVSKTVNSMTSLYTLMFVVNVKRPTVGGSDDYLFPPDRDLLHRDAVALALEIQHDIKYSLTITNAALAIDRLTRMVRRLGIFQEAERIDWRTMCTRQINDTFRPEMRGSMVWAWNQEVLRHLDILDRKVDLVFRFCERHVDALEASEAISRERDSIYNYVYRFYYCHQFGGPGVKTIQEEIERLQRRARKLHELDKSLPLLDI